MSSCFIVIITWCKNQYGKSKNKKLQFFLNILFKLYFKKDNKLYKYYGC